MLKRKCKELNSTTPKWFKEWHANEFLPVKIRQDTMMLLGVGIFIGVIVNLISGG